MTDRKGLADRLEAAIDAYLPTTGDGWPIGTGETALTLGDLRQAAAALRQEPSVEEAASTIAANIDAEIVGGNIQLSGFRKAAQAIAALYRGET